MKKGNLVKKIEVYKKIFYIELVLGLAGIGAYFIDPFKGQDYFGVPKSFALLFFAAILTVLNIYRLAGARDARPIEIYENVLIIGDFKADIVCLKVDVDGQTISFDNGRESLIYKERLKKDDYKYLKEFR